MGGVPAYCDNGRFTWRFFPPRIARAPWSFAFPREKAAGSYRIFLLGGSAAQGDPDPTYGVSRMLRVLLEARHPETRFEVINAGVAAINSHVVLPIARDLARREGDLFVVYLGNNEVVGPFGAGTVFSPLSSSLSAIRTSVFVRGTRIGQLATGVLSALRPSEAPEQWRGLEMFLDKTIQADDPRMESVYGHFRENLEEKNTPYTQTHTSRDRATSAATHTQKPRTKAPQTRRQQRKSTHLATAVRLPPRPARPAPEISRERTPWWRLGLP